MFKWLRKLFKKHKPVYMSKAARVLYSHKFPKLKSRKEVNRYKEMKPPAFYGAGGTWVYPDSWYDSFWQQLKDEEGWTDKELKQGWRWKEL